MNCVVHTIHITMDMMMVATVAAAAAAVAVVWFSSTLYIWARITNTYKSTTQQLIRKLLVLSLCTFLYSLPAMSCVVKHYFIFTCVQQNKE